MQTIVRVAAVTTMACVSLLAPALANEYRLAPGDTIEFATTTTPDLRTRSTIRLDGAISLPLVGDIKVAGLTLSEVRGKIQEEIGAKVYRQRSGEGREVAVMVAPDEVIVTIAEYRPIYVNGDVSKPGAQAFRPGMTARQAIALAGGYDIMHFRMENPFLEEADLRGEYNALWTQYARGQAVILRLEAELANASTLDRKAFQETPTPASVTTQIQEIEDRQLATRNALDAKLRKYLQSAVAKEDERIAVLAEQQQKENAGRDSDVEELTRVQGLFDKKILPITRLMEARRTLLLSSTRFLQTIVEKGRAERGREELLHRLDKLDDERRKDILRDLQDAGVQQETTRARLRALGDKLLYTGLVRSQLVRGQGSDPEITIFRKHGGSFTADQETELQPGDVVEVALQKEMLPPEHRGSRTSAKRDEDRSHGGGGR